jgi:hypothetical protein
MRVDRLYARTRSGGRIKCAKNTGLRDDSDEPADWWKMA